MEIIFPDSFSRFSRQSGSGSLCCTIISGAFCISCFHSLSKPRIAES